MEKSTTSSKRSPAITTSRVNDSRRDAPRAPGKPDGAAGTASNRAAATPSDQNAGGAQAVTLRSALREALARLLRAQVPSASLAAELILMHVLECDRAYLYTHAEMKLDSAKASCFYDLIAERAAGKPTQYITGSQEFWGLELKVTPDVLIPRPETEHLIEAVIELAGPEAKSALLRIVDVGTGSGAIALALAREFPHAEVFATDISTAALGVAAQNAARLGLQEPVRFLVTDLLNYFLKPEFMKTFDFVVSNPPYIARDEETDLQREVRDYEPRLAWGGLERGDEIYRRLFPEAQHLLKPGGCVVIEIGYHQRDAVLSLLGSEWTKPEVRADLAGIPRVITARKSRP